MPRLEELKNHNLFTQLTEKQQRFVQEFCTNGFQLVPAVNAAYTCKNDRTAYCHGKNLLRKWKIRTLVGFMGFAIEGSRVTRAEALYLLSQRLRNPNTPTGYMLAVYRELAVLNDWKMPAYSRDDWK